MGITGLDHVYAETTDWEAALEFWQGLGFEVAETWGDDGHRAGRLTAGDAAVVLAEVDRDPAFNVHFALADADSFEPGESVTVTTPLTDTHWGTRWIRVQDGDGRTYALESR